MEKAKEKQKERNERGGEKRMNGKRKYQKGITLIALVITIIVLLILAVVSIATLTGENGILTKAQDADKQNTQGGEKEQIQLAYDAAMADNYANGDYVAGVTKDKLQIELRKYDDRITVDNDGGNLAVTFPSENVYTVKKDGSIEGPTKDTTIAMEEAKEKEKFETKTKVKAADDKIFTVPAEFKIAEDSADKVEDGVVIEDAREGLTKGSQFVWIPVESEEDYVQNTSYEDESGGYAQGVSEDDSEEVIEKVLNAGGFYISRFEAGKENDSTLVSKSGATVWSNTKQSKCIEESEKFIQNADVGSTMISSTQWDIVMAFVDGKPCENGTFDVTTMESNRHTGEPAESGKNIYDKVCNIFDLEGNYSEYTLDCNGGNGSTGYCDVQVFRSGSYENSWQASLYNMNVEGLDDGEVLTQLSFRFILYII